MDIGFIGLGNMGFHMARRLIEAGHTVIALDTRKEALDRIVALGGKAAASAKEVADRAETVMASLPTPDVVLAVATGAGGVIDGQRVRRFIDLSTTGADMAKRVCALLKARDIVQLDAPVSGGVSGAEKGTVAVMVSGPRAEAEAMKPVLAAIGKYFFIGEESGLGQTMKLCNNFLSATCMTATAEAMVLGVKAGLDPSVMLDVINSSSGRSTASETKFPKNVLPGTFDLGFTNGLMAKDVGLAVSEAKTLGVPMEIAELVLRHLRRACEEIGANADLSTVVQPLERRTGIEVRARKK